MSALVLLLAGHASLAQTVNLTVAPSSITLPDGQFVPMWGYRCDDPGSGASCAAANPAVQKAGNGWSPVLITVPYTGPATSLSIGLTNRLSFSGNNIPTSLVIVGQLGGGLGEGGTTSVSPVHTGQTVTWPTPNASATSTPPPQLPRIQSFGTEVAAGSTATLTWNNLRPGTYLIESGTHPSIQAPMGLYGILVVTTPASGSNAAQAYPTNASLPATSPAISRYDADLPLALSEIDPVQNAAVDAAVKTSGFSETAVWSGLPGGCGNPASANFNTCYPPAVNYSPRYYLINGVSFDRTHIGTATAQILAPPPSSDAALSSAVPVAANTGNVLVRLVNAGLHMHVPSIVNLPMTLLAEDGNPVPGQPRLQNEVFLAPGKTYDVIVTPAQANANYLPATYAIFDRQLSLSTNNQRDGGMQAYIAVAGGASSGVGSTAAGGSATAVLGVSPKTFYCVAGTTLSVTDPTMGLLGGVTGANGVAVTSTSALPGTLSVQSNGTFTYSPPAGSATCGGTFTYLVNNSSSVTSTISQCDASSSSAPGCSLGGKPRLADDRFTGTNAKILAINPPGILLNDVDPSGRPLTVDPSTVTNLGGLSSLTVNPDGSFSAVAPSAGTYTFTYNVKNSQQTAADKAATVTLTFPAGSGLVVNLLDQKQPLRKIVDYRWIIEEDRTFWIDPKCQVNSATRPNDSYGRPCPPVPVEALGYNFHSAGMPVIATGCVGSVSCEMGQTVLTSPAVCDVGDGTCRTSDAAGNPLVAGAARMELRPEQVYLDPNKHYFISVMPGDGINPTVQGAGGPVKTPTGTRQFDPAIDCPNDTDFAAGTGKCGHNMGGAQIPPQFDPTGQRITPAVTISLAQTPLPTAKIAVLVYQDDYPLNGENDAGGGVDIVAPNEAGLGGFQIELLDQAGGLGDNTGQITYDMFNMPLSNALAGTPDPMNHNQDACPLTSNQDNITGMVVTCPSYEADGKTLSPLAGQAVIQNLYPGLYEIQAFPSADRIARGEEWLQTNTLDGGKPHEAFVRPGEPAYFQEFGPGGFHVQIGFANPKIINDRRSNSAGTGICDSTTTGGGGLVCKSSITGQVHGNHMSRTPDERTYDTGTYDAFSFSQCYVSLGIPDQQDFAFAKCDAHGNYALNGLPDGTYKLAVFDQWNDIMLDGLITSVTVNGATTVNPTATQWRTNLYTRTYLDLNGNGIPDRDANGNDLEPGAVLLPIVIRYRDGSIGFKNNSDLNGYATYNEVFPFMNWLVVEPDQTRYKPTGEHVVYDAGGADDCSDSAVNCSKTAAHLAGTVESNSLPLALRIPGAVYCSDADCSDPNESILKGSYYTLSGDTSLNASKITGLSSGRIDPPWHSEGWQGLLGQHSFIDFGMKPFATHENGGIQGLVVYASTRPFDDPTLGVQLQWEPLVPNVQINLYQEGTAADGTKTLTLVDTTMTSSWDKWAQGFQTDGHGNLRTINDGTIGNAYVPNMNCPGQDPTSGFFATLQGSKMWLDTADSLTGNKKPLAYKSQFKCYDGWSQLNQIQPAPYDGKYTFPSVVELDPVTGRPAGTGSLNGTATPMKGTNCAICIANPDDGRPMLPVGKYVVEVITPAGYEIVKEEDKNILMGDIYIAPVTQQFAGLGNVFILPDQAAINAFYNANNPLNSTTNLGVVNPRDDFASANQMWPCVGQTRIVPDTMSLFPNVGQTAPFAGASRPLCDRKEVSLVDQQAVSARFFVFTKNHIAGHFVGGMTNDMASEFDPFSPQFGEKFGVPNLPVRMRDFVGDEVTRVYADQWGAYNGMYFSSWEVNPPNPTGYAPQMSVACMNDPGPILDTDPRSATYNTMITDPAYNPAYSNFCYETPFMPGFTAYMDTPVTPVQAFADHYNLPDAEYPDGTPVIKRADFKGANPTPIGPWSQAAAGAGGVTAAWPLVLTALGDRVVQNPQFAGPSAIAAPYNSKTVVRHYGFGGYCAATDVGVKLGCLVASQVTVGGLAATIVNPATDWSDTQITVGVPSGLAPCPVQQQGAPAAVCGQVVITAGNGKQSIDGITVTVGGNTPTYVSSSSPSSKNWGEFYANPLQTAIDKAKPGDLLIVDAGTYRENLLMWKPVRLQGVGANAVTINADAHPAGKMDAWRLRVSCLFGLTRQGVPNVNNAAFDPSGQYSCPSDMYFRSDRIPFEGFIGWDASSNGNLAQVLQEPSLMGAYEGAGITVLGRGVNQRGSNNSDLWGQGGGAGTFANGSVYVNATTDCSPSIAPASNVDDYATSNYLCNPSSIDGLHIMNSSQGGGGVFLHGWNHNMQIANNRISANAGTLSGAINLGNGETPPAYTVDNTSCGNVALNPAPLCPPAVPNAQLPNVSRTSLNGQIPFQFNTNVHIHHNQILDNASIGDALFSGSPAGAGGVTVSAGSDNYELDHNWIAANLTSSDGGGVAQMGVSFNGQIHNNFVLFNQANNPTLPVDGGGIVIMGAQEDRTLANGQECGTTTDLDCPPGIGTGTGPGLVIDSNLLLGNSAEDGSGGGLRLRQTNGTEIAAFPTQPEQWYGISVTNNIIANNVAGWDGGGVSLQDSFKTSFVNNTVASNDTTASAGVLFKSLGAIHSASPPPGCIPTPDPTQPENPNCLLTNGPHIPQPAGLVTMQNTPNMMAQFTGPVICPPGFGYGDANDSAASLRNGRCLLVSLPQIANDLFWQNRAFHVEIVDSNGNTVTGTPTPNGQGLYSHQNIVALKPLFTQNFTGQCNVPPANEELYWDVGVRMDALPDNNGHNLVFNQATVGTTYGVTPGAIPPGDVGPIGLTAQSSIFSDALNAANVNAGASANVVPASTPVQGQYCNGARIPPEQCDSNQGANHPAMCRGYFTPAGQSETVGVSPVFVFNGIKASATVDEGNNWINMTYGPLSLSRPVAGNGAISAEPTVAGPVAGAAQGAYSITGDSAAVGAGNSQAPGVPATDFYGHGRPPTGVSIGAVEFIPSAPSLVTSVPAAAPAGATVSVTLTGTNFTSASRVVVTGGGVNVIGITRLSATRLTAKFVIAPTAAPGTRSVSVATSSGTSSTVMFTITPPAPPPTLAGIACMPLAGVPNGCAGPASGIRGDTMTVTLVGTNLIGGAVNVTGGPLNGSTLSAVQVSPDGTRMTATLNISRNTPNGPRRINVTTAAGTTQTVTFNVVAPPKLKVSSISPKSGGRGRTVTVTITGTGFTQNDMQVAVMGGRVSVSGIRVTSGTSMRATLTIGANADLGVRPLWVTNAVFDRVTTGRFKVTRSERGE